MREKRAKIKKRYLHGELVKTPKGLARAVRCGKETLVVALGDMGQGLMASFPYKMIDDPGKNEAFND